MNLFEPYIAWIDHPFAFWRAAECFRSGCPFVQRHDLLVAHLNRNQLVENFISSFVDGDKIGLSDHAAQNIDRAFINQGNFGNHRIANNDTARRRIQFDNLAMIGCDANVLGKGK